MSYYFSKYYDQQPYVTMMKDIGEVNYYCCENCGFVVSKTHQDLSDEKWSKLNSDFHSLNESECRNINQPPYPEQAIMLAMLIKYRIIDCTKMLDYAAGHGTLSKILSNYFSVSLPVYDKYVTDNEYHYVSDLKEKYYSMVFNSAMFEHILKRSDLEDVHRLISHQGSLIIHTVICENIPKDSSWFYLVPPVHTAFHTNRSMSILMKQWGYLSSVYCIKAKSWILLKSSFEQVEEAISLMNNELQSVWFVGKEGFVDYWT